MQVISITRGKIAQDYINGQEIIVKQSTFAEVKKIEEARNILKKQNIFIDFDGTICFDTFWRTAPEILKRKIEDFLFRGGNGETLEKWMRGISGSTS